MTRNAVVGAGSCWYNLCTPVGRRELKSNVYSVTVAFPFAWQEEVFFFLDYGDVLREYVTIRIG
jgi:hypothetical protein